MSVESVLGERYVLWTDELYDWGYVIEPHPRPAAWNEIIIRARRSELYGDPSVVIDIAEAWADGSDPDGLRITSGGCFLAGASWHAQFPRAGAVGAERFDVDRTKPAGLIVHRHPLGQPNEVRKRARWHRPETWLGHIERLILEDEDEED
jgi:hypothetical protein